MAQITAGLVKELRERTGAGMMDCKKALAALGSSTTIFLPRKLRSINRTNPICHTINAPRSLLS